MKTLSRFVAKFTNLVVAVLSRFHDVIVKATSPPPVLSEAARSLKIIMRASVRQANGTSLSAIC
jgi:hypothetical protein